MCISVGLSMTKSHIIFREVSIKMKKETCRGEKSHAAGVTVNVYKERVGFLLNKT